MQTPFIKQWLVSGPVAGATVMGDDSQCPYPSGRGVNWEEKVPHASRATRQDGINQSSLKTSRTYPNPISFRKPFQIYVAEINLPAPVSPGPLACTSPPVLTTIYLALEWFMHMPASPTRMWVSEGRNIYEGPSYDFGYCMKDQLNNTHNPPHFLWWFYGKIIKMKCNLRNCSPVLMLIYSSFSFPFPFYRTREEEDSMLWPVQGHRG